MKTKTTVVFALVLGVACSCPASRAPVPGPMSSCDRLSPVMARFTDPDPGAARYEARVSATLLSRVPQRDSEHIATAEELLMVMVKDDPRQLQEAVYILQTPPRPGPREYRVIHAKARENLTFKVDPVEADVTEARLDAELAQALERSWGTMALGARWPDREGSIARMKLAGAFYTFDYRGDNVFGQGDTVSPEAGTCSGALVELGEMLARFIDERDEKQREGIRAELLRKSRALTERLGATSG